MSIVSGPPSYTQPSGRALGVIQASGGAGAERSASPPGAPKIFPTELPGSEAFDYAADYDHPSPGMLLSAFAKGK